MQYFSLLSHLLEVYPETVAQLNTEAFAHVLGTLDFGLHHQVNVCPFFSCNVHSSKEYMLHIASTIFQYYAL